MQLLQLCLLEIQKKIGSKLFILIYESYIYLVCRILTLFYNVEAIYKIRSIAENDYIPGISDIDLLIISKSSRDGQYIRRFLSGLHRFIPLIECHYHFVCSFDEMMEQSNLYTFWRYRYQQMKYLGVLIYGDNILNKMVEIDLDELKNIAWIEINEWMFYYQRELLSSSKRYNWQENIIYYKLLTELYRLYLGFKLGTFFITQKDTLKSLGLDERFSNTVSILNDLRRNFFLPELSSNDRLKLDQDVFMVLKNIVDILHGPIACEMKISIIPSPSNSDLAEKLGHFSREVQLIQKNLRFNLIQCCEFYFSEYLLVVTIPENEEVLKLDWNAIYTLKRKYFDERFKLCLKAKFSSGILYLEPLLRDMNYHSFFNCALFPDLKFFLENNINFVELTSTQTWSGFCSEMFIKSKRDILYDIKAFIYSSKTYKLTSYHFIQGFWKVVYAINIVEMLNENKLIEFLYGPEDLIEMDKHFKKEYLPYLDFYKQVSHGDFHLPNDDFYAQALKFLESRFTLISKA